jgi:protocatechuate 3,4-dioxygenase beta subunit
MSRRLSRREIIESCISRGLLVAATPMASSQLYALWAEPGALKPTPTEVLGPFYKKGAPNQADLRIQGDPGMPLVVSGRVVNTRGEKVPGARVALWHADDAGRYDVQGYRYRAELVVEAASEYKIRTIMPGHYDDRPAQHIHYMISAPGHKTLITQAYFATDPFFEGNPDAHFKKRNIVSHRDLVRNVVLHEKNGAAIQFDICLEKA